MKIQLLADYRGVLTSEAFYPAGEHDLDDKTAANLVAAGRAVLVVAPEPQPEPPPAITRRGRKKA